MQAMARPAYSAITQQARAGQPVIVFTPTRKHARLTAVDFLTFAAADGQPLRFLQVSCPACLAWVSDDLGLVQESDIASKLAADA